MVRRQATRRPRRGRRACTRVTLQNLHGKEGVDGSSPSEGLSGNTKPLQKAAFLLPIKTLQATSLNRRASTLQADVLSAKKWLETAGGAMALNVSSTSL